MGKSPNTSVNSGNIRDSVMDAQVYSDSGSACEHTGLAVLQVLACQSVPFRFL